VHLCTHVVGDVCVCVLCACLPVALGKALCTSMCVMGDL